MTTPAAPRRVLRVGAVLLPVGSLLLARPALAAPPVTWNDPEPMSTLQALLIFGGIPLALVFVITLLVMAPSLVRGDRQQRGVSSWTEPQWFGGPGDALPSGRQREHAAIGQGETGAGQKAEEKVEEPGGASARW